MFHRRALPIVLLLVVVRPLHAQEGMRERYRRIKEATVKVLVDGRRVGSGFAVGEDLVATNFHVVQKVVPASKDDIVVGFAMNIEIELQDGRQLTAMPLPSLTDKKNLPEAIGKDVALLTISEKRLRPLKVGKLADAEEGDSVYLAGYPFGIDQVIITRGVISTKWQSPGNMGQGGLRDVAWLDVSMTTGNSGGPVVLLSDKPDNDVVIGIANFVFSPFAENAEQLIMIASTTPGNVIMMGVDLKKFFTVVGSAMATRSHGVGGCVAIDYLQLPKP